MFGNLTIDSIPWNEPIPLAAFGVIILIVLAVLATITFTKGGVGSGQIGSQPPIIKKLGSSILLWRSSCSFVDLQMPL